MSKLSLWVMGLVVMAGQRLGGSPKSQSEDNKIHNGPCCACPCFLIQTDMCSNIQMPTMIHALIGIVPLMERISS